MTSLIQCFCACMSGKVSEKLLGVTKKELSWSTMKASKYQKQSKFSNSIFLCLLELNITPITQFHPSNQLLYLLVNCVVPCRVLETLRMLGRKLKEDFLFGKLLGPKLLSIFISKMLLASWRVLYCSQRGTHEGQ